MKNTICIDDMKLVLLPPSEKKLPTPEEVEAETLKLLSIFVGIKQRVSKEKQNRRQYMSIVR